MQTTQYLAEILKELYHSSDLITDEEAGKLVNWIIESKKVFVAGARRSGFIAMRMMQELILM
ncbi:hypothetical protein (plasmid) [Metabacillus dongyingensis]|nr:hypothetical protein [Metabacillus dongyingensis]